MLGRTSPSSITTAVYTHFCGRGPTHFFGGGIGQAIAVRFAQEGANVAINYRSRREEAVQTHAQVHGDDPMHDYMDEMEEAGINHVFVHGDVSVEADVIKMVQETIEKLGGLDILINTAAPAIPMS